MGGVDLPGSPRVQARGFLVRNPKGVTCEVDANEEIFWPTETYLEKVVGVVHNAMQIEGVYGRGVEKDPVVPGMVCADVFTCTRATPGFAQKVHATVEAFWKAMTEAETQQTWSIQ